MEEQKRIRKRKIDKKSRDKDIENTRKLARLRYKKNIDYYRIRDKKNYQDNKKMCQAHNNLNYAISIGKIKRPNCCSKCESKNNLVNHHEDYNKPFEFEVLCITCHNQLHHLTI